MKKFSKLMAAVLALVLCLSLLPMAAFAAEGDTLSDGLLKPGKEDIIDKADSNAQDLLDNTNDALKNPSKAEGEDVTKGDIVGEDGKVIVKDGSVLDQAADAITNAGETKDAVDAALTVGEGEDAKPVDEAINDETAKADQALADANKAAADAAKAVEARDQKALDKAKEDADTAAAKAGEAYNNAQSIFDNVINDVLKGEDGTVSAETHKAIADKVAEAMKDVAVPGEDATDEAKADYQSKLVSAQNAAKVEVANDKIAKMYGDANGQIEAAQTALSLAQTALETAKGNYDSAVAAAKVLKEGTSSDIEAYVNFFNGLTADSETAQKVADAYGEVDNAKTETANKKSNADTMEENPEAMTTKERVERDNDFLIAKGDKVGCAIYGDAQLKDAFDVVAQNRNILINSMEQLETESDPAKRADLWQAIDTAMDAIYSDTYNTTLIRSPYDLIHDRSKNVHYGEVLDVNKGLNAALDRLTANLETVHAQYEQLKAEEALKKTLAELTDLSYEKALQVVEGFKSHKDCPELADAAEKLAAQKQAAEEAAQKVTAATAAYEAALAAVKQAITDLTNAKLNDVEAQKAKLNAALADLEKAKQDKKDAEDAKKAADDAVIETQTTIDDIIGGTTTIDEPAVPLAAGPVTRAEFIDYLWRHEGEPDSDGVCTFTDVPEDHDYVLALAWAEQNGIIEAYEDGTFEPDELVTVAAVREFLGNFADVFGTNAVAAADLTTLVGEDDEAVLNCDEVLAEFFGEEYVTAEDEAA